MNNNANTMILGLILLAVVIIGGFLFYQKYNAEVPANDSASLEINLSGNNKNSSN
jgi:hypothetical protein